MIQMGKSMPCLYEQMVAVPAMASAQQSGNSNNSSNNNSNNNASQSYEEMLGGSSGAGGMSLVPQGGASGQFQPTPDKIEESQTVDKMAYNSWKGMLARNIGRAVIVSFLVGSQNTVVAAARYRRLEMTISRCSTPAAAPTSPPTSTPSASWSSRRGTT